VNLKFLPSSRILKNIGLNNDLLSDRIDYLKSDFETNHTNPAELFKSKNLLFKRIDDPDIENFLDKEQDLEVITVVSLTENFMSSVIKDGYYDLLMHGNGQPVRKLRAREVWSKLIGLIMQRDAINIAFGDEVMRSNNISPSESLKELMQIFYEESLSVGYINLAKFVRDEEILWDDLQDTLKTGVRFLNNVVELLNEPSCKTVKRNLGLGVTGFADLLIKLRIPYSSSTAVDFAEKLARFLYVESNKAIEEVMAEKQHSNDGDNSLFINNNSYLAILPSKEIAVITNTEKGIDAINSLVNENGQINSLFYEIATREGFYNEDLESALKEDNKVTYNKLFPLKWQDIFALSSEIAPEKQIKIQAAFQKYVDNIVFKNVNISKETTQNEYEDMVLMAYRMGLKMLSITKEAEDEKYNPITDKEENFRETERMLKKSDELVVYESKTVKVKVPCGELLVTINTNEVKENQGIFVNFEGNNKCAIPQLQLVAKLSLSQINNSDNNAEVLGELSRVTCKGHSDDNEGVLIAKSCSEAIAKALKVVKSE
ncbi:MAG: Ribonucleoside-diphosphate reductase, partial [candidate division CPR2 bacterium GW2011_GWD1_39_7]